MSIETILKDAERNVAAFDEGLLSNLLVSEPGTIAEARKEYDGLKNALAKLAVRVVDLEYEKLQVEGE